MLIPITISFSEVVNVTGTPQLTLETGNTDTTIKYVSGTGTNSLIFNYTILPAHSSTDLQYSSASSLNLNSGTIKDIALNNAVLTLPNPGDPGSLSNNKEIIIDNSPATVSYTHLTLPTILLV